MLMHFNSIRLHKRLSSTINAHDFVAEFYQMKV